jgi:hypothetical protein
MTCKDWLVVLAVFMRFSIVKAVRGWSRASAAAYVRRLFYAAP